MASRIAEGALPPDLIIEILKRLHVRSLWRFRSVCKQWNDIITSFSFKRNHYQYHHNSDKVRLLIHWRADQQAQDVSGYSLFMDETLEQYVEFDFPQLPGAHGQMCSMIGHCNGVFCVVDTSNRLYLWNISTRKVRPLPPPREFIRNDEFGFGVDPLTDEFKIVLIHGDSSNFSIYTSSNDSWRFCESEPLLKDCFVATTQCGTTFTQGVFYWRKSYNRTSTSVILAFDMCNDAFLEIELPTEIRNEVFLEYLSDENGVGIIAEMPGFVSRRQALLHVFEDSLALICFDYTIDFCMGNGVDVWLMKEQGCWARWLSLKFELPFEFHRPLGFWMGRSIFVACRDVLLNNEQLVMHDPNSGYTRMVTFPAGEDASRRELYMFYYKESLFP